MLMVDLMSGCGLRNGEAAAVNLNNLVADDVYRVSEQVILSTTSYGPLKHRKVGEYRDVPLPARIRETIEWYAEKHGAFDGYLLRQPTDPSKPYPHWAMGNQWKRQDLPAPHAEVDRQSGSGAAYGARGVTCAGSWLRCSQDPPGQLQSTFCCWAQACTSEILDRSFALRRCPNL